MSFWISYKKSVYGSILKEVEDMPGSIEYWKNKLFADILIYFFPLGIIVYIPSLIMAMSVNYFTVAVFDTLAIISLATCTLSKKISLIGRKVLLTITLYLMSIVLLIFLGTMGPGLLYILGISILTVLIFTHRAGYLSLYFNTFIYIILSILLKFDFIHSAFFIDYSFISWLVIGINFLLINFLTVLLINSLLKGLQNTFKSEQQLKFLLQKENKELEIARKKAEEANVMKSAFLANMSHEIRTPLNSIVGFSNLIASGNVRKERKDTIIKIVNKQNQLLLHLINDLLDLSKIESNTLEIHKSHHINPCQVIEEVFETTLSLCPEQIDFKKEECDNTDIKIISDEYRIKQILTNFITNAFKYTNEGRVILGVNIKNNVVEFYVKDTGIGLSQEHIKSIFNRFHKIDQSGPGPGLGLSICQSLAELLDADISVKSELNKGSEFSLLFRRAQQFQI